MEVAGGLRSQIWGEDQILTQVKGAAAAARDNKEDLSDEEAPAENQGEAPSTGGRVRPVALEEGKARAENLGRSGR